jgi:hypothetical protein
VPSTLAPLGQRPRFRSDRAALAAAVVIVVLLHVGVLADTRYPIV